MQWPQASAQPRTSSPRHAHIQSTAKSIKIILSQASETEAKKYSALAFDAPREDILSKCT